MRVAWGKCQNLSVKEVCVHGQSQPVPPFHVSSWSFCHRTLGSRRERVLESFSTLDKPELGRCHFESERPFLAVKVGVPEKSICATCNFI